MFFEKFGESIKSRDEHKADQWQFSMFTWDEQNPAAVSGLHNEGNATAYVMEESPGIPANIFQYANGAFTDVNTIKLWLALGNSDDPDSRFEQMTELWNELSRVAVDLVKTRDGVNRRLDFHDGVNTVGLPIDNTI